MRVEKIHVIYFSPSGSTGRIALQFAKEMAELLKVEWQEHSYTLPNERETVYRFAENDLVIWASPVYAGRVPNKTLEYVTQAISGKGTPGIVLAVYGNRNYDQALAEMSLIMKKNGMHPIAGAAVISRHTFSQVLAADRPDEADLSQLKQFAQAIFEKIRSAEDAETMEICIPGEDAELKYYVPKKQDGSPAKFLKAKPLVNLDQCSGCGACEQVCPMGSLQMVEKHPVNHSICIKCQACIRICPNHALYFADADLLSHLAMLEENYTAKRENEFFIV